MGHLLTLHDPQTARRFYEAGVWRADTFYGLLRRHAAERPQAFAARDRARRLTYAKLLCWVDALAAAFAEAGLRPGERVSLWLSNRLDALAAFLACARNGYVCNPSLHRNYRIEELSGLLGYIEARALLIEDGWGADAELIWLPERGIEGNAHFLMSEENSDEILEVLVEQLGAVQAPVA